MKKTFEVTALLFVVFLSATIFGCVSASAAPDAGLAEDPARTVVVEDGLLLTVGLGSENMLSVSKVMVNGEDEYDDLVRESFRPSTWNATGEFLNVELYPGDYVEYTFTQPSQGSNPWECWSLSFKDETGRGQFMRGDNWLNENKWLEFSGGDLWNPGGATVAGQFAKGQDFNTVASRLPTDATVVVKVTWTGEDVFISETVNDKIVFTASSTAW